MVEFSTAIINSNLISIRSVSSFLETNKTKMFNTSPGLLYKNEPWHLFTSWFI